jgi:hypothetical protein
MSGTYPNLTLEVTEPGSTTAVNLAVFMAYDGTREQITISSNFGRQGDTAQIVLVDDYGAVVPGFDTPVGQPHFNIKPLSTIVLRDVGAASQPAGGFIFAGLVTDPTFYWTSPGRIEWVLQCVDFQYYADTAIVQGVYAGLTAAEIVIDLVNQADCGLVAKSVANGGHVYPGPTISLANIPYGQLSTALTTVVGLASQSQVYGWFVDPQRNVWFYPTSVALNSGVTVTDSPTTNEEGQYVPNLNECHIDASMAYSMTYEWNVTTFYTRVVVEGATATHSYSVSAAQKGTIKSTDSWVGNGVQRSWPLSYVPEISSSTLSSTISTTAGSTSQSSSLPFLKIGGVVTKVSVNDGTTAVTTPYQLVQASNGLWTLQVTANVGTTPGPGVEIQLWYVYQLPIIAIANNLAQQRAAGGPNRGIFSDFVSDTSLTTSASSLARAKSTLTEYGAPQETLTFYTDESWPGWMRCGQSFNGNIKQIPNSAKGYALGIKGTFFINQQMVIFMPGGYRKTQITAIRQT